MKNQKGEIATALIFANFIAVAIVAMGFGISQTARGIVKDTNNMMSVMEESMREQNSTYNLALFAKFQNDFTTAEQAIQTVTTTTFGKIKSEGSDASISQIRNNVAKGCSSEEETMLPKETADQMMATLVNDNFAKESYGSLPKITVNTPVAAIVQASYFYTTGGKLFIWPPCLNNQDGLYYVNKNETLKYAFSPDATEFKELKFSEDNEEFKNILSRTIYIKLSSRYGDEIIGITNEPAPTTPPDPLTITKETPVVYYTDKRNATPPVGLEYNDATIYRNTK